MLDNAEKKGENKKGDVMKKNPTLWDQILKNIYNKSSSLAPQSNITAEFLTLLFNYRVHKKTYKFLRKSEFWNKEKLENYQLEQLKNLVNHSYENVPYYKKTFVKICLKPNQIKNLDDIKKIPFLTKEILKENLNDLKAKNFPDYKFAYLTSGGSSGIPVGLYEEINVSYVKEMAYFKMILARGNCKLTDKVVLLRGDIFPISNNEKFWKYSMLGRSLIFSSYHLTENNFPIYIEKIRKFKPGYMITYPSSIILLAGYMKRNNIEHFKSLKTIICIAETLYEWQKELLENIFKCRILNTYGLSEQAANACSCEKSDYLHFFPQYGIVELVDKNGKTIEKDGETGEIVATGFKNYIFPFIRYKTGDLGVYKIEKCICGRNYPLMKRIEGRTQEYIVRKDDKLISISMLNFHSDIFDNVQQFQFFQEEKGKIILKIIKRPTYTDKDTNHIIEELGKKIGKDVEITIEFVDEIPRTKRGKHNLIIQKITNL
jgi:phenylacetate-CoA ligase